jgi:diguanylate cyclase (GGDEF)-like protein
MSVTHAHRERRTWFLMPQPPGDARESGAWRRLPLLALLTAVYFVAGKLGLRLAFVHPSATAVWAPTGIALAAFLILGHRIWPAILLGAFLVNLTTAGSLVTSLGLGTGNMLEGLVGAYLVNRFANGRHACERARDIFKLTLLAVLLSTTVSATIGVTTLSVAGFASWLEYGSIWLTWWLGDAVGALLVAPAILLWTAGPSVVAGPLRRWTRRQYLEAAALVGCLFLVGLAVFGGLLPTRSKDYPLEFLCIPLFIWPAFRFGRREAAIAILIMSGIAIWGTLRGLGPFVRDTPNESLLLLQAFMGVSALMTLTLAAVVAERRQAENRLRQLAVRDPLTGLANYRQLITELEGEIRRSQRTGRPFAVLLLDLDGLKKINDRHGHLVGSRALCRLADALRASSRVIDTAARYGGDEFTLILPETDEAAAEQVARRIAERLATDREPPVLSASAGVAVFPQDGDTIEALLGAADGALYAAKPGARGRTVSPR